MCENVRHGYDFPSVRAWINRLWRWRMAVNFPVKARAGGGIGKRVAVLVDAFDVKYQAALVRHLRMAAEQRRVQLLVFPGGILNSPRRGARQRNRVYDLIGRACVDGIVLLSPTIAPQVGHDGLVEFCARFAGLPLCSIGDQIDGVPSVLVNNERGVRDMVRHLAVDHGYRRFAFIRGTPGNTEAEARYRVYCSELEGLGIPTDPDLAPAGDFLLDSGRSAMDQLLSRRVNLDAVFACNDYMALGALEAINQHQTTLVVPAVVGFDNIDESNIANPPLSTVEQPLAQMAETAIRAILSQMQGAEVYETYCLEPWLVLRRSCGCSSFASRVSDTFLLPTNSRAGTLESRFERRRDCILAEMSRSARGYFRGVANWEKTLLTALIDDLRGVPRNTFSAAVSHVLEGLSCRECELWRFNDVLAVLRLQTLQVLGENAPERAQAEDLFQVARTLVSEGVVRVQAHARLWLERLQRNINEVGVALSECTDTASLRQRLALELPKLGTKQLIIAAFRADTSERRRPRASIFFVLDSSNPPVSTDSETFAAEELMPERLWMTERDRSFIVLPLFFGHESLGYALFDFEIEHGAVCEALRLQLSASLWKVLLSAVDVTISLAPPTVRQATQNG